MSYARSSLGDSYDIVAYLPKLCVPGDYCFGGKKKTKSVDVPFDKIFRDLREKVEQSPPKVQAAIDKNWPDIKKKAKESGPTVVSEALTGVRSAQFVIRSVLEKATETPGKKALFYSSLGVVGLFTVYAIVRKKSQP